jgi:hypothetical protein
MIKKFNEYEKLLESNSISEASWLDSPLKSVLKVGIPTALAGAAVNTATKGGVLPNVPNPVQMYKNITTGKGIMDNPEDKNVDPEFIKLYETTPIGSLPANVYLRLTGLREIDDSDTRIVMESHLSEESTMMEIANNYYIVNIAELLSSIDKLGVEYISKGINKESADELNKTPITVGTILSNSLKNWYNSGVPQEGLVNSLNVTTINPSSKEKYKPLEESIEYDNLLNENIRQTVSLLSKIQRAGQRNPNLKGVVDDVLNFINRGARGITTPNKSGALLNSNLMSRLFGSGKSFTTANNVTTPGLKSSILANFFKKTGEILSKSASSIKKWLTYRRSNSQSFSLLEKLKKIDFTKISKGVGFLIKKPLKWGAYGYAGYWIANWWAEQDAQTGKEPTREFFTYFEEDMAMRNYTPFNFYVYASKVFQTIIEDRGEDWTEILKGWCQSLNKYGILDSDDLKTCLNQINNPTFKVYMQEHSNISSDVINKLQSEWKGKIELPSLGLYTVGIMSSYTNLMSKFEKEFYGGKIESIVTNKKGEGVDIIATKGFMDVGDEGKDVAEIQASLKMLGIYKGNINGIYDESLKDAVTTLQKNGKPSQPDIDITGKVDPKTIEYLNKQLDLLSTPEKVEGGVKGQVTPRELEYRKEAQDQIERMKAVLAAR